MSSIIDKLKLSEEQDRRIKLTSGKKVEIIEKYSTGNYSLNELAKEYGVSKKLILITVNPKSKEKSKDNTRRNWRKYQKSKEERTKQARKLREYKKELYKKGELK